MSNRERDLSVERLLRGAMAGIERPPASECLDPETMAAWMDGTLAGSPRSFAEAHAARCARCQGMLAVMARTAPEAPGRTPAALRKWMIWLSPALAGAAVVALWLAAGTRPADPITAPPAEMARHEGVAPAPSNAAATRSSDARADRKTEGPAEAKAAPTAKQVDSFARRDQEEARDRSSAMASARTSVEKDQARTFAQGPPAPAPPAPPPPVAMPDALSKPSATADAARERAGGIPVAAPELVQSLPAPTVQQPAQGQQAAQGQQVGQAAGTPPAPQQSVQAAPAQPARDVANRAAGRSGAVGSVNESVALVPAANAVEIVMPGSSIRWRIVAGHVVQHSSDEGATWATQYTVDGRTELTIGAAAPPTVVWIVGRAGAVLLTTDGRTWQRVTAPAPVDLVAITVVNGQIATVTTADKQVFTTSDGGRSWSLRRN
jgi:hypothetical protein